MQIETRQVTANRLLLDPNNYRFHDLQGYQTVNRSRYSEVGVQERALQYLRDTPSFDLGALRDSIISNSFVPFEQIVVERYNDDDLPLFTVVEGNRRAAAIKTILKDHSGGSLELRQEVLDSIQQLP